jgi:hypothetical protein
MKKWIKAGIQPPRVQSNCRPPSSMLRAEYALRQFVAKEALSIAQNPYRPEVILHALWDAWCQFDLSRVRTRWYCHC